MRFVRHLNKEFIDELNRLYADEKSWWHKMVEDEKAFILIRENRIHIMINGGRILQVVMDVQGVNCRTHTDFLSLPREADPYVRLSDKKPPPIERVRGLIGLAAHYQKVKNRVKIFTGQEKQVVQDIGTKYKEIIDLEVGLEGAPIGFGARSCNRTFRKTRACVIPKKVGPIVKINWGSRFRNIRILKKIMA